MKLLPRDGAPVWQTKGDANDHRRLQVHHRVPLRAGGRNALDNLELLCHRCHTDYAG